ncbi:MAG TPA: VOC family protein [Chryseosolibacter sp.]|nr:VOC family protein [Chryseosolibacter sp.]
MATKIFVNLPVKDLKKTIDFFTTLGFHFNPRFTDEKAACMIISDDIFAMLLTEPLFQTFTKKQIADTTSNTEVILALSANSREEVDHLVNRAIKAGGSTPNRKQDHGFMYGWGFEDLDGHLWEVIYMEPSAIDATTSASIQQL